MSSGQGPGRDASIPLSNNPSYQTSPQMPSHAHHGRNPGSISAPSTAHPSSIQGFGAPQRAGHGSIGGAEQMYHGGGQQAPYTPQGGRHSRYSSVSEMGGVAPNIQLQHATPQGAHFKPTSSSVPDALQPGGSARLNSLSGFNAPSTLPSMPSSNAQQHYVPPPRAGILGSSHSHSKSSPIGMDQKYIPFSGSTPSAAPSGSSKIFTPQTPTSALSHSPLGLSDIRPSMGSSDFGMEFTGPNATYEASPVQTNSNYLAPWATYAYDWCKWPVNTGGSCGKMALGSYLEDPHNFIQILDTQAVPQDGAMGGSPYGIEFTKTAEATCAYPVTRISWEPPSSQKQSTDLLATSGDHLRLWSLPPSQPSNVTSSINRSSTANTRDAPIQKLLPLALLSNSKTPEHTAPLTSLDWNTLSPKLIITSSIDTTCTIWDIPTLTAKTQLIAHDKEVYDVRFCAGSVDVFVSCGADGSVRMFDLRSLEHSTIIYEPSEKGEKDKASPVASSPSKTPQQTLTPSPPLLRLAASPHDSHLLATFAADSNLIRILDVRQPGNAIIELHGHGASLNSIEWSPSRRGMLASGADDSLVLVWDLLGAASSQTVNGSGQPGSSEAQIKYPSASWRCGYEVSNISWAPQSVLTSQGGDWLGVCGGRGIWGVKL